MAKQIYRKRNCTRIVAYDAVQDTSWERVITGESRQGYTLAGPSEYSVYCDSSGYGRWDVYGPTVTITDTEEGQFYGIASNDPLVVYRYTLYFDDNSMPVFDLDRKYVTNKQTRRYIVDEDSDLGVVLTEDGANPDSDNGYIYVTTLTGGYIVMLDDTTYYAYGKITNSSVSGSNGMLGVANELILTSHCDSLTHTLIATCGTETLTIGEEILNGSINWVPPIEWADQNATGTTVSVLVTCEIYLNTTLVDSVPCSLSLSIPDDLVPMVDLSVIDSTGLLDVYGGYIQNVSMATVDVTAEGVYGSTIKEYRVICGSLSSAASTTTFALPNAGEIAITVIVLDTRGRSASASATINVLEYSIPTSSISACYRSDASGASDRHGDYAAVIFNASVTPINNQNSARYVLGYRIAGATVWSTSGNTWTYINLDDLDDQFDVSDHMQLVQVEPNNVYEFCVFASDDIRTDIGSNIMALSTNDIIMHVDRSRMAIGIHKVADQDNSVDFGLPVFGEFYGTFEAQFRPKRVITDSVDFDELTTTGIYTGYITAYASSPRQNCYISLEVTHISYTTDSYAVHQKAVTIGQNDITLVYERVYTSANGWDEWVEIVGATAHEHYAPPTYSIVSTNEYRSDTVTLNSYVDNSGSTYTWGGRALLPLVKVNMVDPVIVQIKGVTLVSTYAYVNVSYYYRRTYLGTIVHSSSSSFVTYESGNYELNLYNSTYSNADCVRLDLGIASRSITKDDIADLVVYFEYDVPDLTGHRISYHCSCGIEPSDPTYETHTLSSGYESEDEDYERDSPQGHRYTRRCSICGLKVASELEPHNIEYNYETDESTCIYCGWIYS